MMQNGAEFPTEKGMSVKLDQGVVGQGGQVVQAGQKALEYYTQFAKTGSVSDSSVTNSLYVWNARMNNSVEAFAQGSAAMMFNYSWQVKTIKSKNPKLNFAVASIPQAYPNKPVTTANYWGFGVAKNKVATVDPLAAQTPNAVPVSNQVRVHEAWQFLKFLTLKNNGSVKLFNAVTKSSKDFSMSFDPALDYLKRVPQPAARRDIIESQKNDLILGPFVTGNLISKSWYRNDPEMINTVFDNAIESVVSGDANVNDALTLISSRINGISRGTSSGQ